MPPLEMGGVGAHSMAVHIAIYLKQPTPHEHNLRTQVGGSPIHVPIASLPPPSKQVLTSDTTKENPVIQV